MSDNDRLAATPAPHSIGGVLHNHRHSERPDCGERVVGDCLTATPAPLDCGHDLVGIRLRGYREGRAEALGDVREFVDESHDRAVAIIGSTS